MANTQETMPLTLKESGGLKKLLLNYIKKENDNRIAELNNGYKLEGEVSEELHHEQINFLISCIHNSFLEGYREGKNENVKQD